jgi:hypothetical protein
MSKAFCAFNGTIVAKGSGESLNRSTSQARNKHKNKTKQNKTRRRRRRRLHTVWQCEQLHHRLLGGLTEIGLGALVVDEVVLLLGSLVRRIHFLTGKKKEEESDTPNEGNINHRNNSNTKNNYKNKNIKFYTTISLPLSYQDV